MVNLYELILQECENRKWHYVRRYIPFYIASIGCHIFNGMNQNKKIYTEGGRLPNTRLHTLMVAYPGFGKTFFQEQFLDEESYSILKGSHIKCDFVADVTNANFVGQILNVEGQEEPLIRHGVFEEKRDYIIGIDEFSSITNAFKQTFNTSMDTNLLRALDTGKVVIGRGAGNREYRTDMTLWGGVQPARYDLGSGFARRFIFMTMYPTLKDIYKYRESRRRMKYIKAKEIELNRIKTLMNNRVRDVYHNLKSVHFSQDFYAELNRHTILHTIDELIERLAVGYWVMRSESIGDQLYVRMDSELQRLIDLVLTFRDEAMSTSKSYIVWKMIRDEDKVNVNELFSILTELSFKSQDIMMVLSKFEREGKIKREGSILTILKSQPSVGTS